MSQETERIIKSALMGGFNRKDVMRYLEDLMREHQEALDAYRSAHETLRCERDEALALSTRLKLDLETLAGLSEQLAEEKAKNTQLQAQAETLKGELALHTGAREEREALRRDRDALKLEVEALRAELAQVKDRAAANAGADSRAEQIEAEAREKAAQIMTEALDNARRAKKVLSRLFYDTQNKYTRVREQAETHAAGAMNELEKMRAILITATEAFDHIDEALAVCQPVEKNPPKGE